MSSTNEVKSKTRLVSEARRGVERSWEELLRRYTPKIPAAVLAVLAMKRPGSSQRWREQVVEEVVAMTWSDVHDRLRDGEQIEMLTAWIRGVAANNANRRLYQNIKDWTEYLRRREEKRSDRRQMGHLTDGFSEDDPVAEAQQRDLTRLLAATLRDDHAIEPQFQESAILHFEERLEAQQIAKRLGKPLHRVKYELRMARAQLFAAMEPAIAGLHENFEEEFHTRIERVRALKQRRSS